MSRIIEPIGMPSDNHASNAKMASIMIRISKVAWCAPYTLSSIDRLINASIENQPAHQPKPTTTKPKNANVRQKLLYGMEKIV